MAVAEREIAPQLFIPCAAFGQVKQTKIMDRLPGGLCMTAQECIDLTEGAEEGSELGTPFVISVGFFQLFINLEQRLNIFSQLSIIIYRLRICVIFPFFKAQFYACICEQIIE